jgi:hypothetical protein
MRSNVCKIENGTKDLNAILRECEKVAAYNELTHKQSLQLRLICEEIDGMLPNIIDNFNGDLWIEFENGVCKVHISLHFDEFTAKKKSELVAIAKNKKNASAVGIVGKIRSALENVFLDEENFGVSTLSVETRYLLGEYCDPLDYSSLWSLESYRTTVSKEEKSEDWDELEKSVIASVADDIVVGVKGKNADIIIVKKFA